MHTLSLGQATRERPRVTGRIRDLLSRARSPVIDYDHPAVLLLAHVSLGVISYGLAILLFADDRGTAWATHALRSTVIFAVAFRLAGSLATQMYKRSLRYANALDLLTIAKAIWLGGLPLAALILSLHSRLGIPAAVFVVDSALLMLLWSGLHFGGRVLTMRHALRRSRGKRTVIVGAGDAGMTILKELILDSSSPSLPVAVVDDDSRKWGRHLCGVPVLGGIRRLERIVADTRADEILICIPSASRAQMHDILEASRKSRLPVRSLPALGEIIRGADCGAVSRRDLRSPRIEDLLQREEIRIDPKKTREVIGGKSVLVTGAGGSIGSELCRQIAAGDPRALVLIDKSENGLFYANLESSERLSSARVRPYLVDVVDRDRLGSILRDERPDLVFHAAAHKHVAMLELHPAEAFRNNVVGTRNVAEASLASGAMRLINISTDKAVDPHNYMGLSKKITELCIQEFSQTAGAGRTRFSNVRFGNVGGSTGSVLRLFWEQIQRGGPVRVTDPRATRYFMSVAEAVHLILCAAALGCGGETFVLDMGEPLNILDLAKTMMRFAGFRPGIDIAIEFTGLKTGEKVSESLWEKWEHPVRSASDRILEIREQSASVPGIFGKISQIEDFLASNDTNALIEYLRQIFPEFRQAATLASTTDGATPVMAEAS